MYIIVSEKDGPMKKFFKDFKGLYQYWALLLVFFILLSLCVAFYFDLPSYFTFTALKANRQLLLGWSQQHYFYSVLIYILIFIGVVTISFPGATFLTILSGFLFGVYFGIVYALIGATLGATCIYFIVRSAFGSWFKKRAKNWAQELRQGFKKGEFQYLLALRILPLFPFWIVNIVSGLVGVRMHNFILATLIGIFPGTLLYVFLGNSLGKAIETNQNFNYEILLDPKILVPVIIIGVCMVLPGCYKFFRHKKS